MLGRLISSNIEIVTRYDEELWRAKVDPGQLDQVILNLALNARDAMPLGGKLIIETANRRFEGERDLRATRRVPRGLLRDAGGERHGMRYGCRNAIASVRAVLHHQDARGKGTGLGLSTVYGIVRQSGGHIAVYSEPGRGTSVKVYLPRVAGSRRDGSASAEDAALCRWAPKPSCSRRMKNGCGRWPLQC